MERWQWGGLLFPLLLPIVLKENLAAASLPNFDPGQLSPGIQCQVPDSCFCHLAFLTSSTKSTGPPPKITSVTIVAMNWPQYRLP